MKNILLPKPANSFDHAIVENTEYKFCTHCDTWKTLDSFCKNKNSKDGFSSQCKICAKCATKQYRSALTEEQKESMKQKDKERYASRTQEKIEHDRQVRIKYKASLTEEQKEFNRERTRLAGIKYRNNLTEEQKELIRAYDRERYNRNKLNKRISNGILHSLSYNKAEQAWQTFLPYNIKELEERLQFTVSTTDSVNNLIGDYEIDHIIPQSLFLGQINNNSKTRAFQICWSLLNLRLLPKLENRRRPKDGSDLSVKIICEILFQYVPDKFTESDTNNLEFVLDSVDCEHYFSRKIDLRSIIIDYYLKNKENCFKVI
nr:endonuclease VII [uncultured phage]CAI9752166.1 endonuclease VII [uncultured phage]